MNYSTFRLQNQGGRPAIFWEKETVPKKDRKFGYKTNTQRFPIRKYPHDQHHTETDLVSLTSDEAPPPPKPAKNFIRRNKEKVATKKPEPPNSLTLTQEQLNAILRSVGKVASGSENAVKITIDKNNDAKEIVIESPRRHERDDEDDDNLDDRKERRRKKKSDKKLEDQGQSIYSFLDNNSKPKASSKDRKSRRKDEDEEDYVQEKNQRNRKNELDNEDNIKDKKSRRNRSNDLQDEIDKEIENYKRRNRSKQRDEYYNESDSELRDGKHRRTRSKRNDSDNDDDDYERDFDRKDNARKSDRTRKGDSKERKGRKSQKDNRDKEIDVYNDSVNKEEEELLSSPREKIGLPMDLSWRHMTKAERRRLEAVRQKLLDEEEKKEEERMKHLNAQFDPDDSFKKSPQRHQPTRSDPPATRQYRGDTENSNYTDGNRRGRRSRSPSDQRSPDRSPDLPSYTTPDTGPKGLPASIPKRHLTLAEKKRLEWEKERVESVALEKAGNYDPWGKPGAGAPLRTRSGHVLADYKGRQVRKASYAGKVMMMY